MAQFVLGPSSLKELQGVHPDLVAVVQRAITISIQDFSVHDGIRTQAEQQQLVAAGASQTMDSRHISGHAVDLVPYINGKLRWEWPPIYVIADAVRMAARQLGTPIRWGGAWDIDFTASTEPPEDLVTAYVARRKKLGLKAFIDGPHYELPKDKYP
ncbi:M15 family metallopeptidase [Paucibacter sp. APW11]|uniref:M15 family metallopeptidase n=1 Tax=Roseateles aquae TaxID=3077235 RepID=A0ABU3PIU9_9BURK|nr:M15 family metallopeptidase [Paucibacter sp. APW11]MDT9002292.1 M15 family metallopeptidase [Paucibacter sp. APW11]